MNNPFTARPYCADLSEYGKPEAITICHQGRVINNEEANFILYMIYRWNGLMLELQGHRQMARDEYWVWQGDGEDHPESLTCPILIQPEDMRAILARLDRSEQKDEAYKPQLTRTCAFEGGVSKIPPVLRVTVVFFEGGHEALYVDGQRVADDSTMYACDVLKALAKRLPIEWDTRQSELGTNLPETLAELETLTAAESPAACPEPDPGTIERGAS